MSSSPVAYNADDPVQQAFLAALSQGETGGSSYAATEGTGGSNLAGLPTDEYGFPQWAGAAGSHAAGTFQFQPSTWDSIASEFGLNFNNASDQAAGAWYLAEQTYSQKTGGQSLETALQTVQTSGNTSALGTIQTALAAVWPSVTGNQASPQGLGATIAAALAGSSAGSNSSGSTLGSSNATASSPPATTSAPASSGGGIVSTAIGLFGNVGLLVVGGIVILVALWFLLSSQDIVPSPAKVAKSVF
jgi:hypothetical protein